MDTFLQAIFGVAGVAITACIPVGGAWLKSHLKVASDSAASHTIDLAVTAGKQFVQGAMAQVSATSKAGVKSSALSEFMSTLAEGTEAAMSLRGTSPATVAQRILGAVENDMAQAAPTTVVMQPTMPMPPPAGPVPPAILARPPSSGL
jgi:hypothetical protein